MAETVFVSACLLGIECRWDGRAATASVDAGAVVPACPEVMAGFGVPRPAIQHTASGRVVEVESGQDVTAALSAACDDVVALARRSGVTRAVLKDKSPSCATTRVWKDGALVLGEGLLAPRLRAAGIAVEAAP